MINITTMNPTPERDINDYVEMPGGLIAHRYSILTTSIVVYKVYEASALSGRHSSITHINGHEGYFGDITTRRLPADIDVIPAGKERSEAYRAWQKAQDDEATQCIYAAFPNDFVAGIAA